MWRERTSAARMLRAAGIEVNDFDESNVVASFVFTPRISVGVLRFGASYERYSFGYDHGGSPLPNTLQAANFIVGLDTQFSDSILVRIEAQPGIYGAGMDDLDWDAANVPFVVGGTYIYSPDLQFVLGVGVDVNRKYVVAPGGGIRWKIASQWVLNAVMPTPRLEFSTESASHTVRRRRYQESDISNERRSWNSGRPARTRPRRSNLYGNTNRRWIRLENCAGDHVTAEAGYLPYREFDFHRTDIRYHHESGAAYGTIALHGAF